MNNYTIYCTEEQVKKALELGAPIDFRNGDRPVISVEYFDEDGRLFYHLYEIPTAEQMICWLEEQKLDFTICKILNKWEYIICDDINIIARNNINYFSRKEATIDAIDVALDYLIETNE